MRLGWEPHAPGSPGHPLPCPTHGKVGNTAGAASLHFTGSLGLPRCGPERSEVKGDPPVMYYFKSNNLKESSDGVTCARVGCVRIS